MYSDQRTRSSSVNVPILIKTTRDQTEGNSAATAKVVHYEPAVVSKSYGPLVGTFTGYYSNPGWKDRLARGFQAGTPASGDYETYDTSAAKLYWQVPRLIGGGYYGKQVKRWEATGAPPYTVVGGTAASVDEANNLALKRIYSRIDGMTGDLKALVSAGEAAETIRMLRSPTQALWKELNRYVDDAKRHVKLLRRRQPRLRRSAITRITSVLSGLWLERSFGWNPLLNDIDSLFGSLTKIAQRPFINGNFVVSGKGTSVGAPVYASSSWVGIGADASARWRKERQIDVRYIVGVTLEPRSTLGTWQDGFGIHFSEFVPTVWELIPYSFVADYFSNIGDVVSAFAVSQRNIKWIVKTTKVEYVNTLEEVSINAWSISGSNPNIARVLRRPKGVYKKGYFTRELLATLDLPSLEVSMSGVGPLQGLNMLALVRSSRSVERAIALSLKNTRV